MATMTVTATVESPAAVVSDLAPPALPTEQIGPKGWIRTLLFFKLKDDYDFDSLSKIIETSFRAFKNRTPLAGCEAIPLKGEQDGLVQLRHYGDEIDDLCIKDLRGDTSFPTYAELADRSFPTSELSPDVLCMRGAGGEWPTANDRINVMMAQANFIRGGLILNTLIMHAYADGTTAYKFTEILGEEIRKAQNLPITHPVEVPHEDRAKLMTPSKTGSSQANLGSAERHPEYLELPFTPQDVPPSLRAADHVGHVFYFSPSKIKALKALAALEHASARKDSQVPFLSTNDILTALVWRTVMAAQHPDSDEQATSDSTPCVLGVALDARRRAGVEVHKHTLGNILGWAPVMLDVSSLKRAKLADLAIQIRESIAQSPGYLDSITALVQKVPDVSRVTALMFLDMPGKNMIISSWAEFPYYNIEFGPAFGDRIEAVRVPAPGICHSFQVRLPDPVRGGAEFFVGAMSPVMDRILSDPLWAQFAEYSA